MSVTYGNSKFCCVARDPETLFCYWAKDSAPNQLVAVSESGEVTKQELTPDIPYAFLELKSNTKYKITLEGTREVIELKMPMGELVLPHMTPSSDLRFRSGDILYSGIPQQPPVEKKPKEQRVSANVMLVLHAHLPYVRHPEYEEFFEERWLFEAITETYLPLAEALFDLEERGVRARVGLVTSPALLEMLGDKLLSSRYAKHLRELLDHAKRATETLKGSHFFEAATTHYKKIKNAKNLYEKYNGSIIDIFAALAKPGLVELIGCAATHALLPMLADKSTIYAQVEQGIRTFTEHFGEPPKGFWLSECAYCRDSEAALLDNGIKYTFLDAHAAPSNGRTKNGLVIFRRNPKMGMRVWSAEEGYPGDPVYREFYRDYGFETDLKKAVGLKFHRITGNVPLGAKDPYDPKRAKVRTKWHANDFAELSSKVASVYPETVLTAMYDAELFGHWWFEGIDFLYEYFVALESLTDITPVLPSDALSDVRPENIIEPAPSSWGLNGYFKQWLNLSNARYLPVLHQHSRQMQELALEYDAPDEMQRRVLNQAARELMLLLASDWTFLISTNSAPDYAKARLLEHSKNFDALLEALSEGSFRDAQFINNTLHPLEEKNAIFPNIDYKIFAKRY